MARRPRIEYEGAAYHVMSRGNRGADIFASDDDRALFLETLAEAAGRTAWEIHAFVLMRNHYHLLLVTPLANLVEGMKWFQGAFTQRINARHRWRGHLFQGRYRAQNIDEQSSEGYFLTVADYIHLNPARAGMVGPGKRWKTLRAYPWSSFPFYAKAKGERPSWLRVGAVLAESQARDDTRGRRRFAEHLEARVKAESRPGAGEAETVKQGWCLGAERFRDRLLDQVEALRSGKHPRSIRGEEVRAVGERRAAQLIDGGLRLLRLRREDLDGLRKSDLRKQALAWLVRSRTSVSTAWISDRLAMGDPSNVSRAVGFMRSAQRGEAAKLKQRLTRLAGFRD